jgi:hypothetical protein
LYDGSAESRRFMEDLGNYRVANLFVFYILVFVMMINYTLPIWILIVIESTCYLVIVFMIIAAIFVNSCVSVDLVPDITQRVYCRRLF